MQAAQGKTTVCGVYSVERESAEGLGVCDPRLIQSITRQSLTVSVKRKIPPARPGGGAPRAAPRAPPKAEGTAYLYFSETEYSALNCLCDKPSGYW